MKQKYNIDWLFDLGQLVFPTVCRSCGLPLHDKDEIICISCHYALPRTNYHKYAGNPIHQKFWGRIPVKAAFSFLHFEQGNTTQILLHALKYYGRQDVGKALGHIFGKELAEAAHHKVDCIVPLPLHPAKLRVRGYNQCDAIADGLSESLGVPALRGAVARTKANPTQTKKSRFDRWLNVERIFEVVQPALIKGKDVMLIDDVVTTGSTLEACGQAVLEGGARSLTIATLASA